MRFSKLFWALSPLLMLTSCAFITTSNEHYDQTVSTWRWGNISNLMKTWGKPTRIVTLANGNQVYIYEKDTYRNYPAAPPTAAVNLNSVAPPSGTVAMPMGKTVMVVPTPASPAVGNTFLMTCTTAFEVDPRGIIVSARAKGNSCTADGTFSFSKGNPSPTPTAAPKITISDD